MAARRSSALPVCEALPLEVPPPDGRKRELTCTCPQGPDKDLDLKNCKIILPFILSTIIAANSQKTGFNYFVIFLFLNQKKAFKGGKASQTRKAYVRES